MKRGTKLLLLAGCALILILDAPAAGRALAAGWRGPYAGRTVDARSAKAVTARAPRGVELARR